MGNSSTVLVLVHFLYNGYVLDGENPPPPPAATLHFQNPLGSCYQVQILKKGAIRLEQQLEQPEVGMNTEQLFSTGRLDETLTHV
jgi:hypothetical protein